MAVLFTVEAVSSGPERGMGAAEVCVTGEVGEKAEPAPLVTMMQYWKLEKAWSPVTVEVIVSGPACSTREQPSLSLSDPLPRRYSWQQLGSDVAFGGTSNPKLRCRASYPSTIPLGAVGPFQETRMDVWFIVLVVGALSPVGVASSVTDHTPLLVVHPALVHTVRV